MSRRSVDVAVFWLLIAGCPAAASLRRKIFDRKGCKILTTIIIIIMSYEINRNTANSVKKSGRGKYSLHASIVDFRFICRWFKSKITSPLTEKVYSQN